MPHKKILVTGGAGFIGSHLCELLIDEGFTVKVFDDLFRGNKSNLSSIQKSLEFECGDIKNKEDVSKAVKNVDIIVHLAAINGTRFFYEIPEKVLDVNVKGTLNILEAAANNNVKHVVFSSSSEVYGYPLSFPTNENHVLQIMDPLNSRFSYAGSKIVGELMVINFAKAFGFDYSILRFHNVYGPRMGHEHVFPEFIRRIIRNEDFVVQGDGTQTRSFCYISDAIKGIFYCLVKDAAKNQIFNIGNDKEISLNEVIDLLSKISGKEINPKYNIKSDQLTGSTLRRQPDISKARKLLGYEPEIELKKGLKKTFQWYENHYRS